MGTIDLSAAGGPWCGPPVLPDRRGLGRSCLVRRGRGSLLTGEEVGGEPPPLAVPPGPTCDRPCGPAVASWPPPLAAF